MNDPGQILNRQAQWQKSRQALTWPEKIRLAERVRESVRLWGARPGPVARRPAERPSGGADRK
jgi:hypothetical protein